MTPAADSARADVLSETLAPPGLLQDGEVIILAIKPSGWFVPLISMPVILFVAAVAIMAHAAGQVLDWHIGEQTVLMACVGAGCLRLVVAACQWMSRLYLLTNRRIIRIRGTVRTEVFQVPLKDVARVAAITTRAERLLGLGSLFFEFLQPQPRDTAWIYIGRPGEVQQLIEEALARARKLK